MGVVVAMAHCAPRGLTPRNPTEGADPVDSVLAAVRWVSPRAARVDPHYRSIRRVASPVLSDVVVRLALWRSRAAPGLRGVFVVKSAVIAVQPAL
jgi:hypothetical protein